jgi:hypothetical protein
MRLMPLIIRQFEIMIHFNGVERAIFRTHTTIHADVHVNVIFFRQSHGLAVRAVCLAHPDALRRADFSANITAGAADVAILFIIDENRQNAISFIGRQSLIRIFNSEEAFGLRILLNNRQLGWTVEKIDWQITATATRECLACLDVYRKGSNETPKRNHVTLNDAQAFCHFSNL